MSVENHNQGLSDERPGVPPFGRLLRQLRIVANLTQEELADKAQLSPRAVSDLERGINKIPRKDTAKLLADALELTGEVRAEFEATARGRPTVDGIAVATRTLPADIASFTGRQAELELLTTSAADAGVGVCAIGGLAGVGKTALAVHAAHALAPRFTDGQIFLPLHAHTPGHDAVAAADALASLLQIVGVAAEQIPAGEDARAGLWRDRLAGKKMLLVLDDAIDSEQVRPLLPGAPGCLVLVTSRRHLSALEDARTISIDALPPEQAALLFVRLADRPDLNPADPAVGEIGTLCGCLPLAVGLLARRLHHHPAWSAADLAGELAAARDRLGYMKAEDRSVAAAFGLSYADLTAGQQRLFRRLGLYPGTDVDAFLAAAIDDAGLEVARHGLEDLYDHYLLNEPAKGRYRMHDLTKEYARSCAEYDHPAERVAAIDRVLNYYVHTARLADRHLGQRVPAVRTTPPACVPALDSRDSAVAWMEAERLNLHAAAQCAAASDRPGHAAAIPEAMHEFLRGHGYWHQALALDSLAIEAARHAEGQLAEARALTDLADIQYLTDEYDAARTSLDRALELYRVLGHRVGEANALTQLGAVHRSAGDLAAAVATLTSAIKVYRGLADRLGEANALTELGAAQHAAGENSAADLSLSAALTVYRELADHLGEAEAQLQLGAVQHALNQDSLASASLTSALALYRQLGDRPGEARALNGLADVAFDSGVGEDARAGFNQALTIAVRINAPREEARALEGLGQCCLQDGQRGQGANLLRQALTIYERIRSARASVVRAMLDGLADG